MGGVWTPPIKLVDGIWFGVGKRWIGPATRFTSGYGHVKMRLPDTGGLRIERTDFVPAERRGVLVGLKLKGHGKRTVKLRMQTPLRADVDLPVGRDDAVADRFNLPDTGRVHGPLARLHRVGHPAGAQRERHTWGAAVGSRLKPRRLAHRRRLPRPAGRRHLPGVRPEHAAAARRAVRRHRATARARAAS